MKHRKFKPECRTTYEVPIERNIAFFQRVIDCLEGKKPKEPLIMQLRILIQEEKEQIKNKNASL